MNNKMLYISLAMVVFLCLFIMVILIFNHRSIAELKHTTAVIAKDVVNMQDSITKRELSIIDKVNFSMQKISELAKSKTMTIEEIKSLENSIKIEQMKLDEMKKNMKEW